MLFVLEHVATALDILLDNESTTGRAGTGSDFFVEAVLRAAGGADWSDLDKEAGRDFASLSLGFWSILHISCCCGTDAQL